MADAPVYLDDFLIPPFVYRLPIPAISFPSTKYWQCNFDVKDRLHNVRLLLAARLSADEFLAERSQKSLVDIQCSTNRQIWMESDCFESDEASKYEERVAKSVFVYRKAFGQNAPRRVASLNELSFRAVWKEMAVEEQEEFALKSNPTNAVHDLCRFINQKTRKKRSSQTEDSSASKRQRH